MKSLVLLSLLLCGGCDSTQPVHDADQKRLIIAFPDGVMGGTGRIQGTGTEIPVHKLETTGELVRYYADTDLLIQTAKCGAKNPVLDVSWTHIVYVTSRSDRNDQIVVKCLKRELATHFNAGIGSLGNGPINTAPFAAFESNFQKGD